MTAEKLFKYTIDIEKAESENGRLFIYGVASGLGVDSHGHEMDPAAIQRFAEQIELRSQAGDPVPYLDWHKEGSVLSELGHVVKAEVDTDWNLAVKVELDQKNPAALYLYDSIKNKGKKFGMSVSGKVTKFARRTLADGRSVLRFFDVTLKEISNTTKPIWTPSFGTVLAKAVLDEADAESLLPEGDTPDMSQQDKTDLQPGATTAPAEDAPEASAADDAAETPEADETVEVEKAGARYSKATRAKFLAKYRELGDLLRSEGILEDEDEPEVEKSEPAADDTTEPDESDSADADADKPADDAAADSAPADDAPAATAEPEKSEREKALEKALAEMTAERDAALANAKQPQLVVTPETTKPDERAAALERLNALSPADRLTEAFRLTRTSRG